MRKKFIVGIDEVGRGPLAGPVMVGIVVATSSDIVATIGARDSKLMTERARLKIYDFARAAQGENLRFGVFSKSAQEVDKVGISAAIAQAIAAGLSELSVDPLESLILLDGSLKAPAEFEQRTIIRGDVTEPIISLASVLAKVTRDELMQTKIHEQFPQYNFAQHKGYGTSAHISAIKQYGPCAQHRRTYLKNVI